MANLKVQEDRDKRWGLGRRLNLAARIKHSGGYVGLCEPLQDLSNYRLSSVVFVPSAALLTPTPGDGKNVHRLILSASSFKHVALRCVVRIPSKPPSYPIRRSNDGPFLQGAVDQIER